MDYPESFGVDSKLQFLKLTQNLVNVVNQASCLCKNQDAERADGIKVGGIRVPPRTKIIKYKQMVRRFQAES